MWTGAPAAALVLGNVNAEAVATTGAIAPATTNPRPVPTAAPAAVARVPADAAAALKGRRRSELMILYQEQPRLCDTGVDDEV